MTLKSFRKIRSTWMAADMPAIYVDFFRICAGILCSLYFFWLLSNFPEYSSSTGLIDHALSQRLYWFTQMTLFPASMPDWIVWWAIVIGIALSLMVTAGIKPRLAALCAYSIAFSIHRRNFLVYFVEDMAIQLVLFWLIFLPTGKTLIIDFVLWGKPKRDAAWKTWKSSTVRSGVVRLFLINLALLYWVAGLTKLTSPMWREGIALYAVLNLPFSITAGFWSESFIPLLKILNYGAIVVEVAIPILLLASSPPILIVLGIIGQIMLHLGIVASIGLPFANIALLSSAILFVGSYQASHQARQKSEEKRLLEASSAMISSQLTVTEKFLSIVLGLLFVTCFQLISWLEIFVHGAFGLLWTIGLSQNYHLFDWIDNRNYYRQIEIVATPPSQSPLSLHPETPRQTLLEMHLYHQYWLGGFNFDYQDDLVCSIIHKYGQNLCSQVGARTELKVVSHLGRITKENLSLAGRYPFLILSATCESGKLQSISPGSLFENSAARNYCRNRINHDIQRARSEDN